MRDKAHSVSPPGARAAQMLPCYGVDTVSTVLRESTNFRKEKLLQEMYTVGPLLQLHPEIC